jgi:hypothetical protein
VKCRLNVLKTSKGLKPPKSRRQMHPNIRLAKLGKTIGYNPENGPGPECYQVYTMDILSKNLACVLWFMRVCT